MPARVSSRLVASRAGIGTEPRSRYRSQLLLPRFRQRGFRSV